MHLFRKLSLPFGSLIFGVPPSLFLTHPAAHAFFGNVACSKIQIHSHTKNHLAGCLAPTHKHTRIQTHALKPGSSLVLNLFWHSLCALHSRRLVESPHPPLPPLCTSLRLSSSLRSFALCFWSRFYDPDPHF